MRMNSLDRKHEPCTVIISLLAWMLWTTILGTGCGSD